MSVNSTVLNEQLGGLFEDLRGTWNRRVKSVSEFLGYLQGAADVHGISTKDFLVLVDEAIQSSRLPIVSRFPEECIAKGVRSTQSEVPFLFAELDRVQEVVYEQAWMVPLSEASRVHFRTEQRRMQDVKFPRASLQAPDLLVVVEGRGLFFHIFYCMKDGERIYEVSRNASDTAFSFCETVFRFDATEWLMLDNGFGPGAIGYPKSK